MRRFVSSVLSLSTFAVVMLLAACGGGGNPVIAGPAISVSVAPSGVSTVPAGSPTTFTATVANDTGNKGVTWTVSCSVPQCGTISPPATLSGAPTTYTAPASAPTSDLTVTVRATSAADTSKSDSATVTVPAITVSIDPTSVTVQAGGMGMPFSASANNDPSGLGVKWTISPASGAGTLSDMTPNSVTYKPPVTPPTTHLTVTITATSIADPSKSASASITVPTVVVSIAPTTATVEASSTHSFTATVNPDPANKGVTWTLSPATGAGTLSNVTSTSVTYKAPGPPASLPVQGLTVTITAASVADPLGSNSATITIPPITVSINPDSATVLFGRTQPFTATVQNDLANKGVTWSISPASGAGTLSDANSTSVTYNAPADPPANDLSVAITATPVSDPRQAVQITVTVPAITVSVSPGSGLIPLDAKQQFTATVLNDSSAGGVTWALTQGGTSCSPACGGVAPLSTLSGTATSYTAPPTLPPLPANATVTLMATSAADMTKTASATITLTVGTVKLVPASLDFGRVKFNSSKTLGIILTNTGSTALSITGITFTGTNPDRFSEDKTSEAHPCDGNVPAGISCDVDVKFTPRSVGSFSANLSISDSSADSPQLVKLSGIGFAIRFFQNAAAVRAVVSKTKTAAVPSPTGTSNVGTRMMDLVDVTRNDPYLANGTKRELLVRFWYPASISQGCKPAEYTTLRVWNYFSQLGGIPLPKVRTNSCLNAPITDGAHSIVVFTHGYTGTSTDYTFLFEDLASRGYVVASVNHTYEATAVEFPDGRLVKSVFGSHLGNTVRSDEEAVSFAVSVRLSDLKFVVNELERLNASAESPFVGKLDMSRVALAGHSLGGLTAILGIEEEPRFRAGIVIDGVMPDSLFSTTEKAVLILAAGREQWGEDERRLWGGLRGPRFAVNLRGAEHVTPSDMVWLAKAAIKTGAMDPEKTVAAIRDYIAAFLDTNLRSEPVGPLLTGPSVEYPDAVVATRGQSLYGGP